MSRSSVGTVSPMQAARKVSHTPPARCTRADGGWLSTPDSTANHVVIDLDFDSTDEALAFRRFLETQIWRVEGNAHRRCRVSGADAAHPRQYTRQ